MSHTCTPSWCCSPTRCCSAPLQCRRRDRPARARASMGWGWGSSGLWTAPPSSRTDHDLSTPLQALMWDTPLQRQHHHHYHELHKQRDISRSRGRGRDSHRSQALPVNGGAHEHVPLTRLHVPTLLHSAILCDCSPGASAIAIPAGHTSITLPLHCRVTSQDSESEVKMMKDHFVIMTMLSLTLTASPIEVTPECDNFAI